MPQLVEMRLPTEDAIAIETFEDRLRAAVVAACSQGRGILQSGFSGWHGIGTDTLTNRGIQWKRWKL